MHLALALLAMSLLVDVPTSTSDVSKPLRVVLLDVRAEDPATLEDARAIRGALKDALARRVEVVDGGAGCAERACALEAMKTNDSADAVYATLLHAGGGTVLTTVHQHGEDVIATSVKQAEGREQIIAAAGEIAAQLFTGQAAPAAPAGVKAPVPAVVEKPAAPVVDPAAPARRALRIGATAALVAGLTLVGLGALGAVGALVAGAGSLLTTTFSARLGARILPLPIFLALGLLQGGSRLIFAAAAGVLVVGIVESVAAGVVLLLAGRVGDT